jgi:nuclease S1
MHFDLAIARSRPAPRRFGRARWLVRLGLLPLGLCALAGMARAESEPGHRIVAEIAERFLDPRTTVRLHALLAIDDVTSLAAIADLNDENGSQGRKMAHWRQVAIPLGAIAYSADRDCRGGACVVAKLDQFIAVLRDKSAPPAERLEALKFVVCLATDIHQPLRAADNGDRGGARVVLVDEGRRTNLRQVWDDAAADDSDDTREVAIELAQSISASERRDWQKGSPADWANESHAVAKSFVYRYLPRSGVLTSGYESGAQEVMRDRLRRAGVRLAWILNRSL